MPKISNRKIQGIKFFTSHYGNLEKIDKEEYLVVSISGGILSKELRKTYGQEKGEDYFYDIDMMLEKDLAPTLAIYSKYKKSTKSYREAEYYESFVEEILNKINLKGFILFMIERAVSHKKTKVVFLCCETHREFCHRFILAEYLNRLVLKNSVKELFVGDERQRFLAGRLVLGWWVLQRFFLCDFLLRKDSV